jgi:hypothetical protein
VRRRSRHTIPSKGIPLGASERARTPSAPRRYARLGPMNKTGRDGPPSRVLACSGDCLAR